MPSYTERTIRGTVVVIWMSLVGGFLAYLIRLVLARNLTPAEYGLFYAVYAFIGLFTVFRNLGFNEAMAKYIAGWKAKNQNKKIKGIILQTVLLQFSFALLFAIAIYFLRDILINQYFKNPAAEIVLYFLLLSFLLTPFGDSFKFIFQGLQHLFLSSSVNVVKMLSILLLAFFFFQQGLGLKSPALAYFLAYLILPLLYSPLLMKFFPFSRVHAETAGMPKLLFSFGIPVIFSLVGYLLVEYTDVLLLTYFRSLEEVGLYNAALPTSKLLFYFSGSLGFVIFPLVSEIWAKGEQRKLHAGMSTIYTYTSLTMIPFGLILVAFPEIVLRVLFGEVYVPARTALQVLSIGSIFFTLFSLNANLFSGIGKPKITTIIVLAGAACNLLLNLLLIPLYGILGAAIATGFTYLLMLILSTIKAREILHLHFPWKAFWKIFLSGLLFLSVLTLLKNILTLPVWIELFLCLLLATAVYGICIYQLNVIHVQEFFSLLKGAAKMKR